jgi:hypothetical protein
MSSSWPRVPLRDVCDIQVGRTPRRDTLEYWGGDALWVTVSELNGDTLLESKEHISALAVKQCMGEPVRPGTLLFSFKLSIGKMAVAGRELYTNEAIAALPIRNAKILSREFLKYALSAVSHTEEARLSLSADPASSLKPPVSRTDDLSHIESYSCAKPPGEGVRIPPTRQPSGTLNSYTLAFLNFISPSVPPTACSPLVTRHSPLTPVQSTLPQHRESVSKQRALSLLESALTSPVTLYSKQRTLSPAESTLTQFRTVSPLESALPKKVGGRGFSHSLCLRQKSLATHHSPLSSQSRFGGRGAFGGVDELADFGALFVEVGEVLFAEALIDLELLLGAVFCAGAHVGLA